VYLEVPCPALCCKYALVLCYSQALHVKQSLVLGGFQDQGTSSRGPPHDEKLERAASCLTLPRMHITR
jgi:hypothetical protein